MATVGKCLAAIGYIFLIVNLVVFKPSDRLTSIDKEYAFFDNHISATYTLSKDSYLLRIKQISEAQPSPFKVLFNSNELQANTYPNYVIKHNVDVTYIHISPNLIEEGENRLRIVYSQTTPVQIQVNLSNYRQSIGNGIYLLFADSAITKQLHLLNKLPAFISVLIVLAGIHCYLWSKWSSPSQFTLFVKRQYLFIFLSHIGLLLIFGVCYMLGCTVAITPNFLAMLLLFLLILFCLNDPLFEHCHSSQVSAISDVLLKETVFNIKTAGVWSFVIIAVNCLLYWPSFFHLFRQDDWFMFFSSREIQPGWDYFVSHIDWQLKLPYDRLMFRPVSHSALALNRVLFDTNYVGPHLITFAKHLISVFLLWWLLWQLRPRWITGLFALLFSVLMTNVDAVIWPHLDSYISTAILTVLIIVFFNKIIEENITAAKGFTILVLLLWLNLLTTEITLLMPACVFISYWILFQTNHIESVRFDKGIWCVLLLPYLMWGILYAFHIYAAYPDIYLDSQSASIGFLKSFVNIFRVLILLFSVALVPILTSMTHTDKVYICVFGIGICWSLYGLCIIIKNRKNILTKTNKIGLFSVLLLLSILIILSFGRASYINSMLNANRIVTHYSYILTMLMVIIAYLMIDFNKILSNKTHSVRLCSVLFLFSLIHIIRVSDVLHEVKIQTEPLKQYYDSVEQFVALHHNEEGFSFKIIDRPPSISAFNWYSQTCIDSMFYQFLNNENPAYLLEYDYDANRLRSSLHQPKLIELSNIENSFAIPIRTDFINSLGIKFKEVGPEQNSFFIGCLEVTQKQWSGLMENNPSAFIHPDHPVENVSYLEVNEFITKLNTLNNNVSYRLPTHTEYLYLCRGIGFADQIEQYGWFQGNSKYMTHPSGKRMNIYQNVYDILGNVWEWTATPIYTDSLTEIDGYTPRICFGGSWRDKILNFTELTTNYPVDFSYAHLGFRLVAEIEKETSQN